MQSLVSLTKMFDGIGGVSGAKDLIQKGIKELEGVVSKNISVDSTFTFALAPEFKSMTTDDYMKMDENLKLIILPTTKSLQNTDLKKATWDEIVSIMAQNQSIEPDGDAVLVNDQLSKNSSNFFGTGEPDKKIVGEVHDWFKNLITDKDVLASTQMDIDSLAVIVAATGIIADSFVKNIYAKEFCQKTLIDVGIIRYPDLDHPFFKIYRISLKAWADKTKILIHNEVKSGIAGEFAVRKYKPRDSVLKDIKKESKARVIEETSKMLDTLFS